MIGRNRKWTRSCISVWKLGRRAKCCSVVLHHRRRPDYLAGDVSYLLVLSLHNSLNILQTQSSSSISTHIAEVNPLVSLPDCHPPPTHKSVSYRPVKDLYRVGDVIIYSCMGGENNPIPSSNECLPGSVWSNPETPVCAGRYRWLQWQGRSFFKPQIDSSITGCLKPSIHKGQFLPDKPLYAEDERICIRCAVGTRIGRISCVFIIDIAFSLRLFDVTVAVG